MSRKNQAASSLLVIAICIPMLLHTGLAVAPLPQAPRLPGLLPPFFNIDLQKCWSSLMAVEGCVWEIYRALFSFQFGFLGPACCKAIASIDQNCWPKMFPLTPFFPGLLQNTCGHGPAAKEVGTRH